ncbi:hypothetical protein DFP73DRAFT_567675 [Morchella snyderi]|nr:hypothetical protein DFP73DRAFT_567675 [Morchella snyderi]
MGSYTSSPVLATMKFSSKIIIISPPLLLLLISLIVLPSTATTSTCGATNKTFSLLITEAALGGPKPTVVNTDIKTKTKAKTKHVYSFGGDEKVFLQSLVGRLGGVLVGLGCWLTCLSVLGGLYL